MNFWTNIYPWCFSGKCEGNCKADKDCPENIKCENGKCSIVNSIDTVCKTDKQCRSGTCENGKCIPPCKDDNDCAFGENCVKKVCRPGECIEDKDCGLDGKCLDTVCIFRCKINEDCPKGKECRDGNCGEPQGEECRRDSGKGSFIQIRPTKTADSIVL